MKIPIEEKAVPRDERHNDPLHVQRIVESERRAGVELAWIVVLGIGLCVAAIYWSIPEQILDRVGSRDSWNVNGLLALVVVLPLGAMAFAFRRYGDAVGAQRELTRLSLHDPLTGLPNRRHLREVFPVAAQHARRQNTRAALMFCDLDGFKAVNDTYGHEVGDRLMVAVADRFRTAAGTDRYVSRFAGDEFVIIDPAPVTSDHSSRFTRDLVRTIEEPFEVGEDRISISVSIGLAFAEPNADLDETVRDADTAMYEAKASQERTAVYDASMRGHLTSATAERRLESALTNGEFRVLYQPIVALKSNELIGVESLLRWDDPERGMVRPDDFLAALEETGLIVPVGRWVFEEACRQAKRWSALTAKGGRAPRVTVNVSPRQLSQSDFIEMLSDALRNSGADPGQLYLELSETALFADLRGAWTGLRAAREVGVGLAIDDFGTGYSSISHLRNFDLDLLKLDRSYVLGLGNSEQDDTIVRHILSLAQSLGIATLAEGVSSKEQVSRLIELGCELAQGFFFADAQPEGVIDALIAHAGQLHAPVAEPVDSTAGTVVSPTMRRPTESAPSQPRV